jgi:two-component system, NtrC family, C4-dicarboxylate transport sensor histidine kinase DctB
MSGLTPEKRTLVQRHQALLVLLVLMMMLAPLLIFQTISYTRSTVLDEIRSTSAHTLNLVVGNLNGELARYQALPHLLAADPTYGKLWDPERTATDLRSINLLLEKNKNITGALDLYIMDPDGLTIAASNWESERTFIGRNFGFRPYFREAIQGSLGRYFALGTTSLERGYYFSYPIRRNDKTLGVMVCKIEVGHFEAGWKTGKNEIIVTDKDGIVFLSSNPDWLFRFLTPLSSKDIERVRSNRQYGTADLTSLGFVEHNRVDEHTALIELKSKPAIKSRGPINSSTQYLKISRDMTVAGWKVHILAKTDTVQSQIWLNVFATSILLFSFFTGGAFLLERIRRDRERIDMQSRARAELEHRVQERTLELQQAQSELIQAGKLAALGKMSAGLSHELNQPLAAIRSYSDNAGTFLERGELDPAHANLKNISELTDRMARIIKHLRTYASKDKIKAGPTDLVVAVREALVLLRHRADKEGVTIINKLPDHEIIAHGGLVRLQQVFVNILTNAFDAIASESNKQVIITLEEQSNMYIVEICDSGRGLTPEELERVFDPFFSTKEVGEGVGLGLSISYGIIAQFDGYIEATNCKDGGAAFRVALLKKALVKKPSGKKSLQKENIINV